MHRTRAAATSCREAGHRVREAGWPGWIATVLGERGTGTRRWRGQLAGVPECPELPGRREHPARRAGGQRTEWPVGARPPLFPGMRTVGIASVSCASAGNCAAVGYYAGSLGTFHVLAAAEHGGRWEEGADVLRASGLNVYYAWRCLRCGAPVPEPALCGGSSRTTRPVMTTCSSSASGTGRGAGPPSSRVPSADCMVRSMPCGAMAPGTASRAAITVAAQAMAVRSRRPCGTAGGRPELTCCGPPAWTQQGIPGSARCRAPASATAPPAVPTPIAMACTRCSWPANGTGGGWPPSRSRVPRTWIHGTIRRSVRCHARLLGSAKRAVTTPSPGTRMRS